MAASELFTWSRQARHLKKIASKKNDFSANASTPSFDKIYTFSGTSISSSHKTTSKPLKNDYLRDLILIWYDQQNIERKFILSNQFRSCSNFVMGPSTTHGQCRQSVRTFSDDQVHNVWESFCNTNGKDQPIKVRNSMLVFWSEQHGSYQHQP